ncbi:MAG: TonB family protein [Pyrinomonadaceae bacterium]|nr:TonB family protein [Pyrinomonadaceae bacterium]
MLTARLTSPCLQTLLTIAVIAALLGRPVAVSAQQPSLAQLEAQYQKQHEAILAVFANGPAKRVYPLDARERVREWQFELANSFTEAGNTVDQILQLSPPQADMWRERRETLAVYSKPVTPPTTRTVFGAGEVKPKARLLESPAAIYTDEARAAGAEGEVRIRLVLAADGTVKHVFPMKALKHGLTESAMEAARQIKFTPAMRDEQQVSQFATLSYDFKKGKDKSRKPYAPAYEFYF